MLEKTERTVAELSSLLRMLMVLSEADKQALYDHTLLGRTGSIADIIKAVRFIIQDAPFMTGSIIRLDGGYVLGGDRVGPMPEGIL